MSLNIQILKRPEILGSLALFVVLISVYFFSIDIRATRGASITADEPFYLITTQSLIQDSNIDLRAQYQDHSYRSFFDHPDGLWTQSVPLEDGRLVSPHNIGLTILLIPGFLMGGLIGTQIQMVLLSASTWVLSYLLTLKLMPLKPLFVWLVTIIIALSASAFIYSSEIYPEIPAAFFLVLSLLLLVKSDRVHVIRSLTILICISTLPWLAVKYIPLAALVGLYTLWKCTSIARILLIVVGLLFAFTYILFHLAAYDSLTPYYVNLVYAGDSTVSIVERHVNFFDRFYRLWGLFIDRHFGIARWAPILLFVIPGLALTIRGNALHRLVFSLIIMQILMATFVAITMMGWWFSGRTLMTIFPLLTIPLSFFVINAYSRFRLPLIISGIYSVMITIVLAMAGHSRQIVIAVDPFEMSSPVFQFTNNFFPLYTSWNSMTWVLTLIWIAFGILAVLIAFRSKTIIN